MMRKKILLIIPEMSIGGAQRSLSKLSLALAEFHDVSLIIFNKHHSIAYPYGGDLISLDVVPGAGLFQKLKAFVLRIVRLRNLKKKIGAQVSISFLEGADYINILSKSNDKVILSIRGSKRYDETILDKYYWLRNKILIPYLYQKADVIVCVNQGIEQELKTWYGLSHVKTSTIFNFYNIDEIKILSDESKSNSIKDLYQHPVLITSGRLAPEKGLRHLLSVFYKVKKKNHDLRLVIIGDGPEYEGLIKLCQNLNLDINTTQDFDLLPDVLFLGNQSNVFKYLKGATLYLMNSSSEGFPNGLVEAMICNVPVVSSDCPYGPREILAPEFSFFASVSEPYFSKNGILMPLIKTEGDENIWVEVLDDLLTNRELLMRLSENALERVITFDQNLIISKWMEVLGMSGIMLVGIWL